MTRPRRRRRAPTRASRENRKRRVSESNYEFLVSLMAEAIADHLASTAPDQIVQLSLTKNVQRIASAERVSLAQLHLPPEVVARYAGILASRDPNFVKVHITGPLGGEWHHLVLIPRFPGFAGPGPDTRGDR